jgi:ornithine cyclodeaminase/alanine dehydrogenase-like protein (mu-crystallin family)
MHFIDSKAVEKALPYPLLVDALAHGLQQTIEAPPRIHLTPNHDASCVLIMPAWRPHQLMGVKLVSVWPGNNAKGEPAVSAAYVLISCENGHPVAVLDGTTLTLRRTAAAAALAARKLARQDSTTLVVLGMGALSVPLVQAHVGVMSFKNVWVWGRQTRNALAVVAQLQQAGLDASVATDLEQALSQADVVAAATTATEPFIRTAWVRPGTHLSLIGAFTAQMAEAEPALMIRAKVFADSRSAVLEKGGEVFQAIAQGMISPDGIEAQLAELVSQADGHWRRDAQEITVFKSVGFASLDLIAAELVYNTQVGGMPRP